MARVHLQRIIQLSAAKVKETSCIGAFRARVLIKELIPVVRAEEIVKFRRVVGSDWLEYIYNV